MSASLALTAPGMIRDIEDDDQGQQGAQQAESHEEGGGLARSMVTTLTTAATTSKAPPTTENATNRSRLQDIPVTGDLPPVRKDCSTIPSIGARGVGL